METIILHSKIRLLDTFLASFLLFYNQSRDQNRRIPNNEILFQW